MLLAADAPTLATWPALLALLQNSIENFSSSERSAHGRDNSTDSHDPSLCFRSCEIERGAIDVKRRTVNLAFSSENPVRVWDGLEILDHGPSSVSLDSLRNSAPLLMHHDRRVQVGVVESVEISPDRVGRATVRFSQSALGEEIFNDIKDGIRKLVSVGYSMGARVLEREDKKTGERVYRVTKWRPKEISLVTIPADESVGVARASNQTGEKRIANETDNSNGGQFTSLDVQNASNDFENRRATEIRAIAGYARRGGKIHDIDALEAEALRNKISVEDFRSTCWQRQTGAEPITNPNPHLIGMSERQIEKYSFTRAICMAAEGRISGLEGEAHEAHVRANRITDRGPHSIFIPSDVLNFKQRDQLATTASLGGNVVATDLLASSFIDLLRTRMMVARMGATYLTGLVGNVAIPRQTGGAAGFWAASETAATTESSLTFDQVLMTPKQITSRVDFSWLLLKQSTPSIDMLIRNDLTQVLSRSVDLAALHGVGTAGQPLGIALTSGIGSVVGGTNGLAPTWAHIVGLETEVAADNADNGSLGYLMNARTRGKLKQTVRSPAATDSSFIWDDSPLVDGMSSINGYKAGVSNQVRGDLTKGTSTTIASAIFFGNWADLLIGFWSGLEILTDPYSQAANRVVSIYMHQALDIAVRHPESFAYMGDALPL